jgi:osmotically-inducible protein OsmY
MTSAARSTLFGAALGAGVMFLADPTRGARRRALVRDKVAWATRKTRDAAGVTWRDVGNRVTGIQSRVRGRFADEAVDDATLCDRVRTALGRVTSHQRGMSVRSTSGWITLSGDALESEVASIVFAANNVRGVEGVQNELRTHRSAEGIPMLQGGSARPGRWTSWLTSGWSPTAGLVAGSALGLVAIAAARSSSRPYGMEI